MKTTANYGLKKPEGTDVVDAQNFNDNADVIDTQLKKLNDNAGALSTLKTTAKNTLVAAINEVFQSGADVKSGTISAVNNKGASLEDNASWDDIIAAINAIARGQGNAVESQVLSGATFSNADGIKRTGTMPNKGAITITPSGSAQTIPLGYHNGQGKVNAVTVPVANVLFGTTIAGQNGTMPNKGAVTITPGTADQAIPAGYHNGRGKVKGEPNLTAENIKDGVNINGVVGTLEEKQDLYPGVVNFASNQNTYKAVSYIKGEGLYCSESANKCYLFNNAGTLIKTITVSYNSYTLYPVSVTKNHILWTGQGTDGVLLSDKNGTTIVGESDSRLNGLIDEDNNKLYLENVLSGNCIIYCKDFNLNNLGEQTVVSGSAFGIIPMSTDILVLAKNSSNVVGLYYVNISSNVTIKLAYGDYAFNLLASI
jgi:hypothetical protein